MADRPRGPLDRSRVRSPRPTARLADSWPPRAGRDRPALVHLAGAQNLRVLILYGSRVTGAGLASLGPKPELSTLKLGGTRFGDDDLAALEQFPLLETLDLRETAVTDAGLPRLRVFTHLKSLSLEGCAVSDAAVDALDWRGRVLRSATRRARPLPAGPTDDGSPVRAMPPDGLNQRGATGGRAMGSRFAGPASASANISRASAALVRSTSELEILVHPLSECCRLAQCRGHRSVLSQRSKETPLRRTLSDGTAIRQRAADRLNAAFKIWKLRFKKHPYAVEVR